MSEATKGYDDSPPRNGVIAFYTVLTVAVLIGVDFLLDSYFAKIMDAEVHEKILSRGLDVAYETKAKEQEALEKAGLATAVKTLASQGRGASPLIAPESGAGKAEIEGWSQLKRAVAQPAKPGAAATPAPDATPPAAPAEPGAPPAAGAADSTKAANVAPAPANPNASAVKPQIGGRAPSTGKSAVAPGNRSAPAAGTTQP